MSTVSVEYQSKQMCGRLCDVEEGRRNKITNSLLLSIAKSLEKQGYIRFSEDINPPFNVISAKITLNKLKP